MTTTPVGAALASLLFAAGAMWASAEWWQRHRVALVVRLPDHYRAA